ncbi:hypothetical protein ACIOYV_09850 [Pseudomonas sp. NPDC087342]|uniref:hypothetical protein n=1 Tax=Pseudomonas sp. NPDC087342 TaxID=3364437 RepID=UPI0038304F98
MTASVTPIQTLQNGSTQYHQIYRIVSKSTTLNQDGTGLQFSVDVRILMHDFRRFVDRWHGFHVQYSYQWIRHVDGAVFVALSGSRSVQAAFRSYVDRYKSPLMLMSNNFDYGRRIPVGRSVTEFQKELNELFDPKHGRHGRGGSR